MTVYAKECNVFKGNKTKDSERIEAMSAVFLGIDHLGIAVRDLETARATYRDILGFPMGDSEQLEERGLSVQFVETGGSRLELIAPLHDKSEISGFLAKRGEGIHHVCVRVSDIDLAVETMQSQGAQVLGEGVQRGAHGTRVAFVHPKSAHGVLLELVEERPNEEKS